MTGDEAQVRRTLDRNIATAEAQMQLLMGVAFRDGEKAYATWSKYYERYGFDKALRKFTEKPTAFGKLQGRLMFGFFKTDDRKDADMARREFQYHAKRSHVSQLQKRELERQHQVKKHQHQLRGERAIESTQQATAKQTKKTLSQRF